MRLTSVVTPFTDHNLQLVSQVGVTDVTTRYPGPEPGALRAVCEHVARFGLRIGAVEGYLPIESIITGT
ncbi:MAG: mannonate dehydratase, partial [Armatimonadetes bacterium]|nr:mannonate dehydratase [Armatimonadota bacterium]